MFKELLDLASHWKTIGTLLGLKSDLLDKIRSDEGNTHDRLQKVLSEWLKQVDPPPTWKDIADAVERVDATRDKSTFHGYYCMNNIIIHSLPKTHHIQSH